jgi:hypothetical protein
MENWELMLQAILERFKLPNFFAKLLLAVNKKSNSYKDLKILKKKYPLVLFSHGYQGTRFQNFFTCEALASQGYKTFFFFFLVILLLLLSMFLMQ